MTLIPSPDLDNLAPEQIHVSLKAIMDIRECYRVLEKGGLNIVGEVLRAQGPFYEMDHYPKEDVFDQEFASQYYYHAHREDQPEHGHFHLFLRNGALPPAMEPLAGPTGEDRVTHLVAIAMDAWGYPTELFAVNRWVTDESWFQAEDMIPLLDRFAIDHAAPSWPVNRWMTAMARSFQPQIAALLRHRDRVLAGQSRDLKTSILEDRTLEVTGSLSLDLDKWERQLLSMHKQLRYTDQSGVTAHEAAQ